MQHSQIADDNSNQDNDSINKSDSTLLESQRQCDLARTCTSISSTTSTPESSNQFPAAVASTNTCAKKNPVIESLLPMYEKRGTKKGKTTEISSEDTLHIIKNLSYPTPSFAPGDSAECFGNLIAAKLREMEPGKRKLTEQKLMHILFDSNAENF